MFVGFVYYGEVLMSCQVAPMGVCVCGGGGGGGGGGSLT